jgi:hypothetical protein
MSLSTPSTPRGRAIDLCVAVLVATALLIALAPAPVQASPADEARADAEWILRAQLPDGAIANQLDQRTIWPYLSNFAAIGLARAGQITADPRYADAAWRWLSWYRAHQDASGFVSDYRVDAGVASSTGDMDSTDAYAGTFLIAVNAAWQATGDLPRLREVEPGVVAAVAAIEATQTSDGLTWAKPTARVKYLMDQAEAYAGLRAAATLARTLTNAGLASRASASARRVRAGVQRLWNPRRGAYAWAKHGGGARQQTEWRVLYPDALQQTWAVAFGLVRGARARALMRRFDREQPRWDRPASIARFRRPPGSVPTAVGYWAPAAWAFARVGDDGRSRLATGRLRAAALLAGRAWPFTPADAGQLVMLGGRPSEALTRLLGP